MEPKVTALLRAYSFLHAVEHLCNLIKMRILLELLFCFGTCKGTSNSLLLLFLFILTEPKLMGVEGATVPGKLQVLSSILNGRLEHYVQ